MVAQLELIKTIQERDLDPETQALFNSEYHKLRKELIEKDCKEINGKVRQSGECMVPLINLLSVSYFILKKATEVTKELLKESK